MRPVPATNCRKAKASASTKPGGEGGRPDQSLPGGGEGGRPSTGNPNLNPNPDVNANPDLQPGVARTRACRVSRR